MKPYRNNKYVRMVYRQSGKPVIDPCDDDNDILWVWSLDKTLYAIVKLDSSIGHSTLIAGEPALSSGEMVVGNNGRLEEVSFGSGHYKPNPEHFVSFYNWILDQGLNEKTIDFEPTSKWHLRRQFKKIRKFIKLGKPLVLTMNNTIDVKKL